MPIYEYSCPECHATFEEWVKSVDDRTDMPCPKCGAVAHRIISNTTFVLKGGGWYVTEYGHHTPDHEPEHTASGAGEKSGTSAESKPQTAADTTAPAAAPAAAAEAKAPE